MADSSYTHFDDNILANKFNSEFPLRRRVHREIYNSIINNMPLGFCRVLDVGCGDGCLSRLLADKGYSVKGIDISFPNIQRAREIEASIAYRPTIEYDQKDLNSDLCVYGSYDVVIANHILEHLNDEGAFVRAVASLNARYVMVGVPTCFNIASLLLLGGANYYQLSRKSLPAIVIGFVRVITALLVFKDGVNEGYGPNKEKHTFYFPWIIPSLFEKHGYALRLQISQSVPIAFINLTISSLPVCISKYLGIGTLYVFENNG